MISTEFWKLGRGSLLARFVKPTAIQPHECRSQSENLINPLAFSSRIRATIGSSIWTSVPEIWSTRTSPAILRSHSVPVASGTGLTGEQQSAPKKVYSGMQTFDGLPYCRETLKAQTVWKCSGKCLQELLKKKKQHARDQRKITKKLRMWILSRGGYCDFSKVTSAPAAGLNTTGENWKECPFNLPAIRMAATACERPPFSDWLPRHGAQTEIVWVCVGRRRMNS